jgi:L1 cell adhesion molecule like protein
MSELIPIGIDLGSLHARVAIGNINIASDNNDPANDLVDTRPLPNIISNAQGSRYTLALVGTDKADTDSDGGEEETRHIFGDAARRALAREKKPTISKDPSSMVRQLVRSSSSVSNDENATVKSSAASAFFSHLAELACDASSAHPSKLRTVVSVPVGCTPEEQTGIVETVERGINEALEGRQNAKDKKTKKKNGNSEEDPSVMAVIADPAAVCIAHGLTEIDHPGVVDLSENKNETTFWKNVLVVDWGASGLTATHLCRASANSALLTIVQYISDTSCSGTAIISALAKHCASMFERKNRVSGVMDSKKACHRLEMACESAVRTLSRAPTVTVAVDGLYEGIDMNVPISRPRFDMLMSGILRKAETLLQNFAAKEGVRFDVVLLAGNVCDMPSASNLIRTKLFPNASAGRGDVPPDEAVAIGCARQAASILSCDTHFKHGVKRAEDHGLGPSSVKVKACPLTIGICRIQHGEENGHLQELISKTTVPLIEMGEPLPANITRKIMCKGEGDPCLSDEYIAIVQMQGGHAKTSKVIGKIENIPLVDGTFEVTMELTSAGKLSISVDGAPSATL